MFTRIVSSALALSCIALAVALCRGGGASPPATSPAPLVDPPPASAAKDEAVLNQHLAELRFDSVALLDAVSMLVEKTHANIHVDWRALEGAGIDRRAPVRIHLWDVTLRQALTIILEDVGAGTAKLAFKMSDGILWITTSESAAKDVVTEIYKVRGLMGEIGQVYAERSTKMYYQDSVDIVIHLICDTVVPDSWRDAGGSVGSIREIGGLLIISQTPETQKEIANLLLGIQEALHRKELLPTTRPMSAK